MELTGGRLLPVPRQRVWDALMDTDILRAAIPGCETIEDEGGGNFAVHVIAAVGPVKARFKGKLKQHDLQAPQSYTLSFEGDGGMAGFARGSAEVLLSEREGGAQTQLDYRAQTQIGGRVAQIGSRLIDATAARLSSQFFERLTQLTTAAPIATEKTTGQPAPARGAVTPPADTAAPSAPSISITRPASPADAGAGRVQLTLQMPAWAWAFTVAAIALLTGWLSQQ